ncbi:ParA family protein [Eubacterium sp.]|uniref:ParA family protein n=1 Tax=Eubacterium sp. TaxID=142586 RepID=UPI0026DFC97E|nr:ParA family protein [Eubacterium sp.]MDO5432617.1 ParA family protein [Eubacterium sp.]
MKEAKVFALCNQKGGVGKSNTTVNLGIGLVNQGKKVLAIDSDAQSDLTISLGWRDPEQLNITLATLMKEAIMDEPIHTKEAILHHPEGIDLLPADLELSAMEMSLVTTMSREYVLKRVIQDLKHDYDYILIDTAPSLGMITINALAAADSTIIPVQAQFLSAKGMTELVKTIGKIKRQINPSLEIEGIILTMADVRTNMTKTVAETIREQYGSALKIYRNVIPFAIAAAETSAEGKSIYTHAKGSKVAKAYEAFTKEVLQNAEKQRTQARSAQCR